jgi:hypothetical protein
MRSFEELALALFQASEEISAVTQCSSGIVRLVCNL